MPWKWPRHKLRKQEGKCPDCGRITCIHGGPEIPKSELESYPCLECKWTKSGAHSVWPPILHGDFQY